MWQFVPSQITRKSPQATPPEAAFWVTMVGVVEKKEAGLVHVVGWPGSVAVE
jgi:hypothetical protein